MPLPNLTYKYVDQFLSAAVASGGTFTVNYPTGTSRGTFLKGKRHQMIAMGATFNAPDRFTVTLNTSNITITYNGSTTIPAGTLVRIGLDVGGDDVAGAFESLLTGIVSRGQIRFVNLGSPVATSATALRAAAAIGGAGAITLLTTSLDVPRNLIFTSVGNDSGITFTINSLDLFGNPVRETVTGANAGVAAGVKAHYRNITVSVSGASAGNVSIGFGNVLGLPVYLPNTAQILKELQDNANATAGTTVAGLAIGTKSTATTADVRGTYVPNSAPDGNRAYELILVLEDPDFIGNPQFAG